jgi:hypothetical protein
MEANPYKSPTAPVADLDATDRLDVTWTRATKVWWSLLWRGLLFGSLAGFAAGFVVGITGAALGANRETISQLGTLAGVLTAVPVGIWVVRTVLRKSWSDFRIAIVARNKDAA